jgi:hypothetical protein
MNDPLIRLLIVAVVVVVAGLAVWAIRGRGSGRKIRLDQDLLGPGTYFFTSETCAGCVPARDRLVGALGSDGFREIRWESQPEMFEALEIDAVPATLVVDKSRRSTLYPGDGRKALETLNP